MAKCSRCGRNGLMLKLTSSGLCHECNEKKIRELETKVADFERKLTPDVLKIVDINALLEEKEEELEKLKKAINETEKKRAASHECLCQINARLVYAEEAFELESFALYRPTFSFATSEEYKERLDQVRSKQKDMIKNGKAASCSTSWTVQGSESQGRKFAKEMTKLFIRAFNNECDIAVKEVSFSNFAKCRERITKSFNAINSLGQVSTVHLSDTYRQLKLEELTLCHEYQCKKEEEKEAIRVLKAQQREEAKLAKEIAEARKEAEKERKHYLQALEKLKFQAESAKTDEERYAISEKQNEIIGRLDDLNRKMEDIDYRQNNQRAGYVYIISNIGSFGEGIFKIGMTRRLDPMERIYELGDASVPFMFDVHAMIFSDDAPKLEACLHQAFDNRRVNMINPRREYFRVSLDEIKKVVRENHDKTVEFVDLPSAQQYRETLLMQKTSRR